MGTLGSGKHGSFNMYSWVLSDYAILG